MLHKDEILLLSSFTDLVEVVTEEPNLEFPVELWLFRDPPQTLPHPVRVVQARWSRNIAFLEGARVLKIHDNDKFNSNVAGSESEKKLKRKRQASKEIFNFAWRYS